MENVTTVKTTSLPSEGNLSLRKETKALPFLLLSLSLALELMTEEITPKFLFKKYFWCVYHYYIKRISLWSSGDVLKAFKSAWAKACKSSSSSVDLIIPRGEFYVGPLTFYAYCTNVSNLTVRVKVSSTLSLSQSVLCC